MLWELLLNYYLYAKLLLFIPKLQLLCGIAKTIELLCTPLKIFHINPEEIRVLVCICLSMIPILKNEYMEVKMACRAKNIPFNIRNSKIILIKLLFSCIRRVNQIDEALIEKGYDF